MLNRNFAIALAVAMVLAVLYGCSSSGGIKNDRDMYKEDAEMLQGSLDAANEEVTRLTGELATATMMAGDNASEVTRLEGELATATMMAGDNAAEVTRLEGELATAEMARDDNASEVTRLEGELATATMMAGDNAAEVTRLEGELATAEMARDDNASEVMRLEGELATATMMAGDNAAEVTRLEGELTDAEMARDDNADEVARLQELVDAADAMQTVYTPNTHQKAVVGGLTGMTGGPGDGGPVTVTIDGSDPTENTFGHDQTADADGEFMVGDETAPDAGKVWVGSMFARMSAADATPMTEDTDATPMTEDKVFVYSDRTARGPEGFQEYYGTDGTGVDDDVFVESATSDGDDPRLVLTFDTDVDFSTAEVASAWFPAQPSQTFTLTNVDDTDTEDMVENAVAGSYRGIPGMYSCEGVDECMATTDGDGKLMTLTNVWRFIPEEVAEDGTPHMIEDVVADDAYAYFGYWLHVTNPGTDDEAIGISAFAGGGTVAVDPGAMAGIAGTASYNGKAGGKYAVKTLTSNGQINSLQVGQFVADVALNATFGGSAVAVDDQHKISGTVSKFMDPASMEEGYIGGGAKGWTVTLDEADTNNAAGGATNGGMMDDGSWTHAFHDRGTDDDASLPPGYVTGTFDAHFMNGHVLGAFGAEKAD